MVPIDTTSTMSHTLHCEYNIIVGSDLSSIVINSSLLPFPIGEDELFISFFDAQQNRIRTTINIAISKCTISILYQSCMSIMLMGL